MTKLYHFKKLKYLSALVLGIFGFGGAGGFLSGASSILVEDMSVGWQALSKVSFTATSYTTSFVGTGWAKNGYIGIYTDYWYAKAATSLNSFSMFLIKPCT